MKKTVIALAIFGLIVGFYTRNVLAKNSLKVTICHATASSSNPYVQESVDISSLGDGHGNNGINPNDIVPPTPNTDFPNGNNWTTTGQAIYNNGCNPVTITPTPTSTPTVTSNPTPTITPLPTSGQTTPTPALDCDGDTDGSNPNSDDICVTLTPTPSLDCDGDTDGSTPNEDDEDCATPTVTVTVVPTITPTVTPTITPTTTPTPTITPTAGQTSTNSSSSSSGGSGSGGSSSSSSSNSSSNGQIQAVLSASTFAGTGTFDTQVMNVLLLLGIAVLSLGTFSYLEEKKVASK